MNAMNTLQSMRVFTRVVESGTFTAAAQQMNATTASISRAVADLESHLRTRLLNRTTRRLALTEAGERYLQRCEQILAYVEQAEAEAADAQARPCGKLRVHAMTGLGQHYVVPAISRYQETYCDVRVDLMLAQRMPDLLDEGYDVSLMAAPELPDSGLVSQWLGNAFSIACASPDYLRVRGIPKTLAELKRHVCLRVVTPAAPTDTWIFDGPEGEARVDLGMATFKSNLADATAVAVKEGMGIGVMPLYSVIDGLRSGKLVRILPGYTSQAMSLYAVYPSRQYLDAKIRTWVDFLRTDIPQRLAADQAELGRFALATG